MRAVKFLPLVLVLSWPATAQGVSKSVWIERMSTTLPAFFCESGQYFRQCYRVSAQRCEEVASSATRICLNRFSKSMPTTFKQREDGEKWGATVGRCAGETYGAVLNKEFTNTPECNNPNLWVK